MENKLPEEVHHKVRRRYAEISCSIKDRFKYPTGREGAIRLGYDVSVLKNITEDILESFCGVGNPFSIGLIHRGETVLDIGCGGGVDVIIARRHTDAGGYVYGIDLVPEMAKKAQRNIMNMSLTHCGILCAGSEALPFDRETFDVVISNGAVYLSPLKERTLQEIYRVLKPGGRLQFADVVMKDDLPEEVIRLFDGWSG